MKALKLLALFILLSSGMAGSVFAAGSNSWTATINGAWQSAGNWSGGVNIPGTTSGNGNGDTATFNTSTGVTVTINSHLALTSINFDGNVGSFTLSSGGLFLASGGGLGLLSTVTSTGQTETISTPITANGSFGLANNSASDVFNFTSTSTLTSSSATNRTWSLSGTNTGANTISGIISNNGVTSVVAITKGGAGTWVLGGANTYTGGTSVSAGTLVATNTTGSATGLGTLSVARGGALAGTGTSSGTSFAIGGTTGSGTANVYVGQTAATGDTNTTSKLTLLGSGASTIANAKLTFNLDTTSPGGSPGLGNELLVGGTAITFGSGTAGSNPVTLTLNLQGGQNVTNVPYFVLIAGTAGNGTLATTQYSGLSFGTSFAADGGLLTPITNSGVGGSGNLILALNLNGSTFYGGQGGLYLFQTSGGIDDIVVIPEPGTWALMLGGLAVLVFWQRRKCRA